VSEHAGFAPGSLLGMLRAVSARARAAGALQPIPTEQVFLEDGGVRFLVRVLSGLARKQEARERQQRSAAAGKPANPFLPPEPELLVADVSETHLAILNKYQVVDDHLLVVTREFEEQRSLLTPRDFEALWRCLGEYPSLGFYNGGPEAGASQPHKHLQLVPLPLARGGPEVPISPLLASADASGEIAEVPGLGFLHAFVQLARPGGDHRLEGARQAYERYRALLEHLGYPSASESGAEFQAVPYCLLVTPEWMLLVPRSREHFRSISINALGFAGALLVWDEEQLRALREAGPFAALRETALPAPEGHRERQETTSR
jgi:ATP adenylyltransferase